MPTFQIFKCERKLQELVFINNDLIQGVRYTQTFTHHLCYLPNTEESEIIQKH